MIKDEFNRLMKIFHEGAEGKPIDLQEMFKESLAFFEHLKEEFKSGTPEEKKEVMQMMGEMYKQIQQETMKICKASGYSEEQLLAFAENPGNFTPEQWKTIQESKSKIHKAGQDLVHTVEKMKTQNPQGTPPSPSAKKATKKDEPPKKTKKTNWLKS